MHQSEMAASRDSRGKGKAVSGGGNSSNRGSGAWKSRGLIIGVQLGLGLQGVTLLGEPGR